MGNTEKITGRILEDARNAAREIARQAGEKAEAIRREGEGEAERLLRAADEEAARDAAALKVRLGSAASLEARKRVLREKQLLVDEAFARARALFLSMPREEYASLLADLAASASVTGREQLVFSRQDLETVGAEVCRMANETRLKDGKPAALTLAEQAGDIEGGFILREGPVETNCTADVLIGGLREELAGEVAAILLQ